MRKLFLTVTVAAALASTAYAGVLNGDFDDGTLSGWTKTGIANVYNAGGSAATPDSPSGQPFAGAITSFGSGEGSISQMVDLTGPGYIYLEFLIGNRGIQPEKLVTLQVLWNDEALAGYTATAEPGLTGADLGWRPLFEPLVGTGQNTLKITWDHNFTERAWTLVDNVVVGVPEPATIALLALGMLPVLRRRRA